LAHKGDNGQGPGATYVESKEKNQQAKEKRVRLKGGGESSPTKQSKKRSSRVIIGIPSTLWECAQEPPSGSPGVEPGENEWGGR